MEIVYQRLGGPWNSTFSFAHVGQVLLSQHSLPALLRWPRNAPYSQLFAGINPFCSLGKLDFLGRGIGLQLNTMTPERLLAVSFQGAGVALWATLTRAYVYISTSTCCCLF